jgi:hypothetical protein
VSRPDGAHASDRRTADEVSVTDEIKQLVTRRFIFRERTRAVNHLGGKNDD